MPPGIEDGPPFGQYVAPDEVPDVQILGGAIKVLLGAIKDGDTVRISPINSHHDMDYFVVTLGAGGVWRYSPPPAHDVAWAFVFEGAAILQGEPLEMNCWCSETLAPSRSKRPPNPHAF